MKTLIRLRIVPNARKSEVIGRYGEAIKIRIQAPAVEGKANAALRDFLAAKLQISAKGVELAGGEKSRDKSVWIEGLSAEDVAHRLLAT